MTFDDIASYATAPYRPILVDLRRRIHDLGPELQHCEGYTGKQRIRYALPNDIIFLEIKVQREAIVLHMINAGLPDPDGITTPIPESYGWRQLELRIRLSSSDQVEAAMGFIKAAYQLRLARSE